MTRYIPTFANCLGSPRLSSSAVEVLGYACKVAVNSRRPYWGPGDIVLGIAMRGFERCWPAALALYATPGFSACELLAALNKGNCLGPEYPNAEKFLRNIQPCTAVREAVLQAHIEADCLEEPAADFEGRDARDDCPVEPEHLLLAMCNSPEKCAGSLPDVLKLQGITLAEISERVLDRMFPSRVNLRETEQIKKFCDTWVFADEQRRRVEQAIEESHKGSADAAPIRPVAAPPPLAAAMSYNHHAALPPQAALTLLRELLYDVERDKIALLQDPQPNGDLVLFVKRKTV